ncbi:response regulator [Candidatus Pacearchaeota archaeon]|nr:response regulator [Candidatus Pacearchaeota archaeon]
MKILFIDDLDFFLKTIKEGFFKDKDNVVVAECHSIDEALTAIENAQPDILFLDHSLTEDGNEGLEIAGRIKDKGIKIYSTTSLYRVHKEYAKLGIEVIEKSFGAMREFIERIRPIINGDKAQ